MMKFLLPVLALVVVSVALWVALLRPWLRKQPWAQGFFAAVEPIERRMYLKSETILWARTQAGVGLILETLTQFGAIDFSPMLDLLPPQYSWVGGVIRALPVIVMLLGFMQERMRRDTTKPLSAVAVAPDAPPAALMAAAEVDAAAKTADAVIKEAT